MLCFVFFLTVDWLRAVTSESSKFPSCSNSWSYLFWKFCSVAADCTVWYGLHSFTPGRLRAVCGSERKLSCQVRTVKLSSHDCLSYYEHQCNNMSVFSCSRWSESGHVKTQPIPNISLSRIVNLGSQPKNLDPRLIHVQKLPFDY